MSTKPHPLDRVTMKHSRVEYFAGQFLEDKDLKNEQQYHMMRRRQLNKEQFSPGIRRGFSVEAIAPDLKTLRVQAGAAMDCDGREVWLDKEHILEPAGLANGDYFLCMQVLEVAYAKEKYSLPKENPTDKGVVSSWEGDTRNADTIEFSLVRADQISKIDPVYIKLASIQCVDGTFQNVDSKNRPISTTSLGGGLTINASGHYVDMYYNGDLNAYIGPEMAGKNPHTITFSSMSKRMDLAGDGPLYMFNRGGVVVASERGGAGTLHVQGMSRLQKGLVVTGDTHLTGSLKVGEKVDGKVGEELAITGTELKSLTGNSGVTIDSGAGRLSLKGESTLYITNKDGVVIVAQGGSAGTLYVQGKAHLQRGVSVSHEIQVAGAELKLHTTKNGRSGVIFDSQEGHLFLDGKKALYISNKNGVVIEKDGEGGGEGKAGSLHVEGQLRVDKVVRLRESLFVNTDLTSGSLVVTGKTTLGGDLDVTGDATVGKKLTAGSLEVTGITKLNGALTVVNTLSVPGATFTSHGGTMKLKGDDGKAMHISGNTMYLLPKDKVHIRKEPSDGWNSTGDLVVDGTATINDLVVAGAVKGLVVHSPGTFNLASSRALAGKLPTNGDFMFFVEKAGPGNAEQFFIVWKTSMGVKFHALEHNIKHLFPPIK